MTLPAVKVLKDLKKEHIRLLLVIESGMRFAEYVDIDFIYKNLKYNKERIDYILKFCHKMDLVNRWQGHFVGYELTTVGYDALALDALYESRLVADIGQERGVGKESKVFFARTPSGEECIIKIHRVGYTSFTQTRKKRRYTSDKRHLSALYASKLSADEEIKWMKKCNQFNLPVPKFMGSNRHIIVMELIEGYNLNMLKDLDVPEEYLIDILEFIYEAWCEVGFVHGDLSAFNIIISVEGELKIIDFPQAVERSAENAVELLERDIQNILTFFDRKFQIKKDETSVLNDVLDCVHRTEN